MKIISRFTDVYDFTMNVSFDDTLEYRRDYAVSKVLNTQVLRDLLVSRKHYVDYAYSICVVLVGMRAFKLSFKESTVGHTSYCSVHKKLVTTRDSITRWGDDFHDRKAYNQPSIGTSTGSIAVRPEFAKLLASPLRVDSLDAGLLREQLGCTAGVAILKYERAKEMLEVFQDFSFQTSGLTETLLNLMSIEQASASIENYLIQDKPLVDSRDDLTKVVSAGFDKKQSFRNRK